jgi:LmbE family N-acetylglucosaminyl deacetylase
MLSLNLSAHGNRLSVLCLGAHSDDIEIGLGGTLLSLMARGVKLDVHWCVLSAVGDREAEARKSAVDFLTGASSQTIETLSFRDGFFPEQGEAIKSWFEDLKSRISPDLIFTHRRDDAHQDHREVCRLTWNTFRDHFILEYEIPKWDGDLGQPNLYVSVPAAILQRKIELLNRHFATQRSKQWFDADTFQGLARRNALPKPSSRESC